MPIIPFQSHLPQVSESVFIAPDAWIIGKVNIAEQVSVFFGTVIRGDIQAIHIGTGSNLQEHVTVHTSTGLQDCIIGAQVTVGHGAILHGCSVRNNCIIGMAATILDGAEIGENSIVGANALVSMNTKIPPGSLVVGVPGKVVRQLRDQEIEDIRKSAKHYQELGTYYRETIALTRAG